MPAHRPPTQLPQGTGWDLGNERARLDAQLHHGGPRVDQGREQRQRQLDRKALRPRLLLVTLTNLRAILGHGGGSSFSRQPLHTAEGEEPPLPYFKLSATSGTFPR